MKAGYFFKDELWYLEKQILTIWLLRLQIQKNGLNRVPK